jgi:hypothetical protein
VLSERGHVRWGGCIVLSRQNSQQPDIDSAGGRLLPFQGRECAVPSWRADAPRLGLVSCGRRWKTKLSTRPRGRRARLSPLATLVDVTNSAISARKRQKETRHTEKKTFAGDAYLRLTCSLVPRPLLMARDVQFNFCEHIRPPLTVGATYIIISRPWLQVQTSMTDCPVVVQPAAPARPV